MPAASTPAAAPAPAAQSPVAPITNDSATSDKNLMAANANGTGGFKIDQTGAGASVAGGSGLNIPTK